MDFLLIQIGFLIGPGVKKIAGCRHIKNAENGPEIFDKRQRKAPDGNSGLKVGDTIQRVKDPKVPLFIMSVFFVGLIVFKHLMLRKMRA